MSAISENCISAVLTPPAIKAVRKGHPWVYADNIVKQNKEGVAGDLVVAYDKKRKFAGIGLYDPESPIRIRMLQNNSPETIDKEWFIKKIEDVFSIRQKLINDRETTGYRLISGENDGIPGLVLDRYEDTLTLKLDTAAWLNHIEMLKDIFIESIKPERIVLRLSRTVEDSPLLKNMKDGDIIYGSPLKGFVIFQENGILFESDPIKGQKTGFFLDQRENRAKVEKLSAGKNVLNVFSYTGGFSLYAARGGAKSVTSLDLSKPALDAAERNFKLNKEGFSAKHISLCGDAFEEMAKLAKNNKKYGVVIVDPPSFARKQSDAQGAMKAYARLIKLAVKLVETGGILVAASCSSRVSFDDFFTLVTRTASVSGRKIKEIDRTTHATDHPIGFPEGAYLKCIYLKIN
jgi:23S rRNA (cytosine1962-C5)-methyltransferase